MNFPCACLVDFVTTDLSQTTSLLFFQKPICRSQMRNTFLQCVMYLHRGLNYTIKMPIQHYGERPVRANFPTLLWFCLCHDDVIPLLKKILPPFIYRFHRNSVFLLNAELHLSCCTSCNFFSSSVLLNSIGTLLEISYLYTAK